MNYNEKVFILFLMKNVKTLFDVTIGLENIFNEMFSLKEDLNWTANILKESVNLGSVSTYRANIQAYKRQLEYYNRNYALFDDFGSVHTTDKYFTEIVTPMRDRAEKSLNVFQHTAITQHNSEELLIAIEELKEVVNEYIKTCVRIIRFNPRLEKLRHIYSVERLIEKYNLIELW